MIDPDSDAMNFHLMTRADDQARIAALEATVARLTAEVSEDEASALSCWIMEVGVDGAQVALTAFLERRMKG